MEQMSGHNYLYLSLVPINDILNFQISNLPFFSKLFCTKLKTFVNKQLQHVVLNSHVLATAIAVM